MKTILSTCPLQKIASMIIGENRFDQKHFETFIQTSLQTPPVTSESTKQHFQQKMGQSASFTNRMNIEHVNKTQLVLCTYFTIEISQLVSVDIINRGQKPS